MGLTLNSISKSFGRTRILDSVSVDVRPGEFLSLVGPSGCGKSTLLRIVAGLEVQDEGGVTIGGRAVDHLAPSERDVAMVFQSYALYPHMSAFDNVALPLMMARLRLAERLPLVKHLSPRRRRIMTGVASDVCSVASQLRIEPLLGRKPAQMSGGQRQRVALARAMVRKPSLFLMDEPLSNLDAQLRIHMRAELADLHKRLGATFVYVTHDQGEAMTMSDRIALMDEGRILQVGTPAELYDQPATLAAARFLGTPPINVLAASSDARGQVLLAGRPLPGLAVRGREGPLSVAVRPEAISMHLREAAAGSAGLPGHVRRNEHHGAERILLVDPVEPGLDPIACRVPLSALAAAFVEGTPVHLELQPSALHLFDGEGRRVEPTHEKPRAPVVTRSRILLAGELSA